MIIQMRTGQRILRIKTESIKVVTTLLRLLKTRNSKVKDSLRARQS